MILARSRGTLGQVSLNSEEGFERCTDQVQTHPIEELEKKEEDLSLSL